MGNARTLARLYATLAASLEAPQPEFLWNSLDNPLLAALGRALNDGLSALGPAFDGLRQALEQLDRAHGLQAVDELRFEHTRLFFGPPAPAVLPYEHSYREGGTATDALSLRRFYERCGVTVSPGFHDLPDHVCVELEFMAHLLDEGASVDADRFHREHLIGFLLGLADAIRKRTDSPYYAATALVLDALAKLDQNGDPVATEQETQEVSR